MVSLPPLGMASRAFTTRFMMTCSSRPASASTASCEAAGNGDQLDVLADQAAQHLLDLEDELVDAHDARLERLAAAEGQQLVGQLPAALGRAADLLERRALRVLQIAAGQQQVAVAGDHGQQVVEIVGHAARQAAHGLHLLRLPELLFQARRARGAVWPRGAPAPRRR